MRGGKAAKKQREIAAQNNVRSKTVSLDRLVLIHQVSNQRFEGHFALGIRTLIKSRQHLPRLQQRHEFLKEIRGDNLHPPQKLLFFESAQNRQAVRSADVDRVGTVPAPQQSRRLPVGVFRTLVRFDDGKESEMRSQHREAGGKSAQLFGVVESSQLAGDGGYTGRTLQFMRQQLC